MEPLSGHHQGTIICLLPLSVLFIQQSCSFQMTCPSFCICDSYNEGFRMMCSANNNIEADQTLEPELIFNIASLHIVFSPNVNQLRVSFCENLTETNLIELRLEGHANMSQWTLKIETVSCFRKLRVLQLRDMGITAIENGTLSNLLFLEEFDVSRNRHLLMVHVVSAFNGITAHNLKIFNISKIHSRENMPLIVIDHNFFNIFKETNLEIFDISWTRASVLIVPIAYYIPNVVVINITGTDLTGNSDCLSSGLLLKKLRHVECNNWPVVIRDKRSTRSSIYPSCNSSYTGSFLHGECYNTPPRLEVLYLQKTLLSFVYFRLHPVTCFNPSNVLKFLSFRGTRWPAYRPFSVFKGLLLLETFDLSEMGLDIISPETFRYMPSLKYLDLSFNNLYQMDVTSFALSGNLSVLDLSINKFESFEMTVISNNFMLKTLNLSQNTLKSFIFNSRTMFSLTTIDLSNNEIQILDLSDFYSSYNMENTANKILTVINITNNSIICDCSAESASFIEWFLSSTNNSRIQLFPNNITCGNYDSKLLISYAAFRQIMIEKCESDHLEFILGISIPLYAVICIGYIVGLARRRTLLQRLKKWKYLYHGYDIVRNPTHTAYICVDEVNREFVSDQLLPNLKEELLSLTGIIDSANTNVFAAGYDIIPGTVIRDETLKLISSSLCVIVIICRNFLESEECEDEFRLATQLKKRIIILYKDDCQRTIKNRTTRPFFKETVRLYRSIQWPLPASNEHEKQIVIKKLAVAISTIYRENQEMLELDTIAVTAL